MKTALASQTDTIPQLPFRSISTALWHVIEAEGLDDEQAAPQRSDWLAAELPLSDGERADLRRMTDTALERWNAFDIELKERYGGRYVDLINYDAGTVTIVTVRRSVSATASRISEIVGALVKAGRTDLAERLRVVEAAGELAKASVSTTGTPRFRRLLQKAITTPKEVPFSQLPETAQKSIAEFWYVSMTGMKREPNPNKLWGYAEFRIEDVVQEIMNDSRGDHGGTDADDDQTGLDTFEAVHEAYYSNTRTPTGPQWPITLDVEEPAVLLLDGNHRLHSYWAHGLKTVPAVWYVADEEPL